METMKKAWKDASSTPEGAERDKASADGSYLEVKLPDLLVSSFQTGDAPAEAGGGFDAQGRLLVGTDGGLFGSSIDPNPPSCRGSRTARFTPTRPWCSPTGTR